jgi:hypothetical protein
MPRKKSVTAEKSSEVKDALMECKMLCEDSIGRTLAEMVSTQQLTSEQAEQVTAAIVPSVSDSIFRIIARKG